MPLIDAPGDVGSRSNRDLAVSRGDRPAIDHLIARHDIDPLVQRTRRADVTRNRPDHVSRLELLGQRCFEHEVFFVVQHLNGIRQHREKDALAAGRTAP